MNSPRSGDSPVRQIIWHERVAVAHVEGDIDLSRSTELQQQLLDLLAKKPERIIINLSDVPYMDSSGVASLVKLLSRARKQGVNLSLAAMTPRVRNVFEITRLDSVFEIHDSEKEAIG